MHKGHDAGSRANYLQRALLFGSVTALLVSFTDCPIHDAVDALDKLVYIKIKCQCETRTVKTVLTQKDGGSGEWCHPPKAELWPLKLD